MRLLVQFSSDYIHYLAPGLQRELRPTLRCAICRGLDGTERHGAGLRDRM